MLQVPRRHHYIPEFYLRRWTSEKGTLVQFSRPRPGSDEVKALRVYPKQTGFVDRLYELRGLPPEQAQELETAYFRPVDTQASIVLGKMERGVLGFSDAERTAWTQFVMSLTLRYPEMLQAMLESMRDSLRADLGRSKRAAWMKQDRPAMLEAMRQAVDSAEVHASMSRSALAATTRGIANLRIGQSFMEKKWGMMKAPVFAPALLTSDRPVVWHAPLSNPEFCMVVPVGPKTMFYAVNEGSRTDAFFQSAPILTAS